MEAVEYVKLVFKAAAFRRKKMYFFSMLLQSDEKILTAAFGTLASQCNEQHIFWTHVHRFG